MSEFDKFIDRYTYYNCNRELGYYVAFYQKVMDEYIRITKAKARNICNAGSGTVYVLPHKANPISSWLNPMEIEMRYV